MAGQPGVEQRGQPPGAPRWQHAAMDHQWSGGASDERQRQREFDERGPIPGGEVLYQLKKVVQESDGVLAGVTPTALLEYRRIQGLDVTILEAIYSVVSHFSMHTGQIILLTKMWKGDLGFFDMSGGTPRPRFQRG
mgnify:CR=1 FL=1